MVREHRLRHERRRPCQDASETVEITDNDTVQPGADNERVYACSEPSCVWRTTNAAAMCPFHNEPMPASFAAVDAAIRQTPSSTGRGGGTQIWVPSLKRWVTGYRSEGAPR